jgi:hypothetical protein
VLSRAFLERDPDSGVCYDFAPGHVEDESPPCRVGYLLENNCASCHGKEQQEGRLDLSRWVAAPDGRMTFPHTDSRGRPFSRETTLQRISDRLSQPDPRKRMPLESHMSPLERQELFVWANQMLEESSR